MGDPRLSHSEIAGLLLTHTVNLLFDCRPELFDHREFDRWVETGEAPAIPSSLRLYMEVRDLGFKTFLLTGRSERAAVDLLCTYASSPNPHTAFRFSQELSRPFRFGFS